MIDRDGVHPLPDKVKAIEAIQLPSSAKDLKSVLAQIGYYRRFCPNFSKVTAPLRAKIDCLTD